MAEVAEKTHNTQEKPAKNGRFYELYVAISPEAADTNAAEVEGEIKKILQEKGAEIKKTTKLAKSYLAYTIDGVNLAYTASFYFEADSANIAEIEAELHAMDINFLRLMIAQSSKKTITPARKPVKREKLDVGALEKEMEKLEKQTSSDNAEPQKEEQPAKEQPTADTKGSDAPKKEGSALDDIDKKLDEIMGEL